MHLAGRRLEDFPALEEHVRHLDERVASSAQSQLRRASSLIMRCAGLRLQLSQEKLDTLTATPTATLTATPTDTSTERDEDTRTKKRKYRPTRKGRLLHNLMHECSASWMPRFWSLAEELDVVCCMAPSTSGVCRLVRLAVLLSSRRWRHCAQAQSPAPAHPWTTMSAFQVLSIPEVVLHILACNNKLEELKKLAELQSAEKSKDSEMKEEGKLVKQLVKQLCSGFRKELMMELKGAAAHQLEEQIDQMPVVESAAKLARTPIVESTAEMTLKNLASLLQKVDLVDLTPPAAEAR